MFMHIAGKHSASILSSGLESDAREWTADVNGR
jgi:hypothetical protein